MHKLSVATRLFLIVQLQRPIERLQSASKTGQVYARHALGDILHWV